MAKHSKNKNPLHQQLNMFVGDWKLEASFLSFRDDPSATVNGSASCKWVKRSFLILHTDFPDSEFPTTTSIIGMDDTNENYYMLYSDSRGVYRMYNMSLSENLWTLERSSPGFSQRFTARFSADKNIFTAEWEKSTNGINWEHDFDLTYTKIK